ncbi:MAG TPA: ATP-binding cassette domain-containing protein [Thermoanaerobaculia bacterium]|nr:ATP-binding cassette domain-containing protein [Thermoanaerobaculia bacterium]
MTAETAAVEASGLEFSYRDRQALRGVSFSVAVGEVYGFLGPNGGGKTTLFRILATLASPARGALRVFGHDVAAAPAAVRRLLGVVFQAPSLDLQLTVRENLLHQGWLHGLAGGELARRAGEQLARFGLAERAGERAATLSGGLRRRVEIAKALLHAPRLLLLDEPSSGLDPGARRDLWDVLAGLRSAGVTVLLTTHHMDEADRCDRLALLDGGAIVAEGAPTVLKDGIGGDVVTLGADDPDGLAAELAARFPELAPRVADGPGGRQVRLERERAHELVPRLAEAFPGRLAAVTVARPTLEDVFLQRTGHPLYVEERP